MESGAFGVMDQPSRGQASTDYPLTPGVVVASSGTEGIAGANSGHPPAMSISAAIAEANARLPKLSETGPRFPAEDGGQSLVEMACGDLDAALQLLADRAHYITGASGAAIALRRGEHSDMLCRASAGSNAPELGALLSMEYGLSGESVRTRQAMRCDNAESDPRVNREGCRELGIASVVVMPIVSDTHTLGVFELFSGKPYAFDERDISALKRLSEMVETMVKHAVAAQAVSAIGDAAGAELQAPTASVAGEPVVDAPDGAHGSIDDDQIEYAPIEIAASVVRANEVEAGVTQPAVIAAVEKNAASVSETPAIADIKAPPPAEAATAKIDAAPPLKKPLFWSAVARAQADAPAANESTQSIAVLPMLRNLQKCQACGFPVSQGRKLCVECEEKQFRGQRIPATSAGDQQRAPVKSEVAQAKQESSVADNRVSAGTSSAVQESRKEIPRAAVTTAMAGLSQNPSAPTAGDSSFQSSADIPADVPTSLPEKFSAPVQDASSLFLSSTVQSESWFAANKYVLFALLIVIIAIGAIAWLH